MKLNKKLILASGSPRRKQILSDAGFEFDVEVIPVDEDHLPTLNVKDVATYLSAQKASQFSHRNDDFIVIAADTVVIVDDLMLNKPASKAKAVKMLRQLSGRVHSVITGVSIKIGNKTETFYDETKVSFMPVQEEEILYYIEKYSPLDKAGSYGIQDFLGMVRIDRLEGSFYTVMGLPIHLVYEKLKPYIELV